MTVKIKFRKFSAIMSVVLILPTIAHAKPKVIPISEWKPRIGSYQLDINGRRWMIYNAQLVAWGGNFYNPGNDWAIKQIAPKVIRFELRNGDQNWFDRKTRKERSEIGMVDRLPSDTPIRLRYTMMVEKGQPNTAHWVVLGQLHQDFPAGVLPTSSPFAINLHKNKLLVVARWGEPGAYRAKVFVTPATIERGKTYSMDISVVFGEHGRLHVARDGATIADYKGPLGYSIGTRYYWKMGLYRLPDPRHPNGTLAVRFSDPLIDIGRSSETVPASLR